MKKSNSFFIPALVLIFITLKLTGHISWSWVWVLCPIWIPFAMIPFIVAIILICRRFK